MAKIPIVSNNKYLSKSKTVTIFDTIRESIDKKLSAFKLDLASKIVQFRRFTGRISDSHLQYVETVPIPANFAGMEAAETPPRLRYQYFVIDSVEQTEDSVTVTASHIWYQLRSAYTDWKGAENTTYSGAAVCGNIMDSAMTDDIDFLVASDSTNTISGAELDYAHKNICEAFLDPENGVCKKFGLSLIRDNWTFYCLQNVGYDRGFVIEDGKNLLGVDRFEDATDVVTRIIPFAKTSNGDPYYMAGTRWVDADNVDDYIYPKVYLLDTGMIIGKDGVTQQNIDTKLRQAAQKEFDENKVNLPKIELDVSFVSIGDTEEYKQYRDLDKVYLYDIITVKDKTRGYNYSAQVVGVEHDVLTGMLLSVKLGSIQNSDGIRKIAAWQVPAVDGSNIRLKTIGIGALADGAVNSGNLLDGIITTDKLFANSVTTEKLNASAVTTEKLDAQAVTADKIAAGAIEAQHFSADALTAINAEIQNANISYAKIKDANVENLITKDAIADRYYIDKLQVRNLQVIEQTVGNLVVKAKNGNYYRLDVGNNGAVTSTQVTVTSGEIAAGVTNTGRSIIETDLTVSDLAASNIKGANALIDKLTAARISVDELFARDATIGKLQTTDISSNTSLQTYVADRLDFTVGKLPFVNPNMLLAADTDVQNTGYPTIVYDPYVDAVTGQEATLVVGEQYTFTVRLQTQSAAAGNVMLFTGGGYAQLVSIPLYSGGTAWATYSGTFTFNGYGTQHPEDHQLRVYCTPQGRPVRIQWAKLEKGDHATDFCLSPAEMKNSGISIKPDSLNIYSSGTMNIASDGKMVIESGAEGRINLNDGSISAKNLNAQELTVGGKQVGVNAFMLSLPAVFTQGASSAPAGHGFLWMNAAGSSYSSAQTRGATSDGYLPRTFTLDAPENTLSAGTFTYTCTCAITNRQGSNPATITPNITVKITNKSSGASVSFAFDQVTVRKWESKNLTKTVTTTVNLFGTNAQFDAECTFTRSGGTTGTPDMDSGVDIVLTATKQNAGGAQNVTVQYVP